MDGRAIRGDEPTIEGGTVKFAHGREVFPPCVATDRQNRA